MIQVKGNNIFARKSETMSKVAHEATPIVAGISRIDSVDNGLADLCPFSGLAVFRGKALQGVVQIGDRVLFYMVIVAL